MKISKTKIAGLFYIELDLFPDERGSFREAWQSAKMEALGLPHFVPVQYNISESKKGVTRGIHGEDWDKYLHVTFGTAFAALVDLRLNSPTFGQYETFTMDQSNALFVPKGFGNSYQALTGNTIYSYLVTEHWSPEKRYLSVNMHDVDLNIPWPIPKDQQIISDKDRNNPSLRQAFPDKYK